MFQSWRFWQVTNFFLHELKGRLLGGIARSNQPINHVGLCSIREIPSGKASPSACVGRVSLCLCRYRILGPLFPPFTFSMAWGTEEREGNKDKATKGMMRIENCKRTRLFWPCLLIQCTCAVVPKAGSNGVGTDPRRSIPTRAGR